MVVNDAAEIEAMGISPITADLVAEGAFIRHDAERLARLLFDLAGRKGRPAAASSAD